MTDPRHLCTCLCTCGHRLDEHTVPYWHDPETGLATCAIGDPTSYGTEGARCLRYTQTADLDRERASHARTQHALDVLFDLTQGALAGRASAGDELAEANAALAEWGLFDFDLHALLADRLGEVPDGIDLITAICLTLSKAQTEAYAEGRADQATDDETELRDALADDLETFAEGSASPFPPDPLGIVTEDLSEIEAERGEGA